MNTFLIDVPETKVEIRGAPYSHNVFKGQNISFQRGNRPEMHLSISSSAFSSQCVPRGPTDSKLTSVPLNHACAFFANLLTEYYNTPPQHNTQTTNIEDGNQSEFDYPDSLSH